MSEEMETPGPGQIRGFVCFAGNPVLSTPNGERLAGALSRLEFMVAIDYFINETTRHAHMILPPSHVFESGNFDLLMLPFAVRHLAKYSPPILEHAPDSRDDWEILSELAMRVGLPRIPWLRRMLLRRTAHLPERIVDWLLRAGRWGDHFLPWRKGLRLEELGRTTQGIDLGPLEPAGRHAFRTPDGKARLVPAPFLEDLPRLEQWIDSHTKVEVRSGEKPFSLIGRRHLRSNNSWMHNERSLVKGPDRAQLHMNRGDAEARGFREGALVRMRSRTGELTVPVVLSDDLMTGVVSLPHGYGHQVAADTLHVAGLLPGGNANALTDELLVEPIIGNSILNGVQVWIDAVPSIEDAGGETRSASVRGET
jgi:anaerobic selenocysteine-containing dehydrogenase